MTEQKMLYSLAEAAEMLSVGKRKVEELVRDGALDTVTIGRRRLVPVEALTEYVERLKAAS
jgi:excisionase family DNA binding protein